MMTLLTSRAPSTIGYLARYVAGYVTGITGLSQCPQWVFLNRLNSTVFNSYFTFNSYSTANSYSTFNKASFFNSRTLLQRYRYYSLNNCRHYCALLSLTMLITLAQVLPSYAQTNNDDLFIPETKATYNPLRTSTGQRKSYMLPSAGMSNEDLINAANDIRTSNMSTEQRALNHQWLDHENYVDDAHVGGKVLSHIFKMGFKTYWKDVRNKKYSQSSIVPTEEGVGQLTTDVDYKFRVNGDNVKFSVEYEF